MATWKGFDYKLGKEAELEVEDWQMLIAKATRTARLDGDLGLFDKRGKLTHEIYDNPNAGRGAQAPSEAGDTEGTSARVKLPRPQGLAIAARQVGKTGAQIWAVADQMWEAVGKPTDKATVLTLRKAIMDRLEASGIKRTSSSNELGSWQKARI